MARCMLLLLFLFMPTSAQAEIRNPDPGLSIGGAGGSLATTIMGLGTGNDAYTRLLLHFDRDNSDASPWRRQQIAGAMAVPSSVRSKF
ncbi:MAG: hypothetical protein FJ125_11675, partial [Deltaproteobacteria bacterium]|nr:hypothetical protein [Deltaproteobacteria bacterium]